MQLKCLENFFGFSVECAVRLDVVTVGREALLRPRDPLAVSAKAKARIIGANRRRAHPEAKPLFCQEQPVEFFTGIGLAARSHI